jgi:glutamine synthetase
MHDRRLDRYHPGQDLADQQIHRRKGMRLPESVLLQTVTGDYVEDDIYYELLDPADIDMICRPDQNAVYLVPWAIEPTAR